MSKLDKESINEITKLGTEVVGNIVRPSSKSVGDNLGLFIDGVMGWLGLWGEKQKIKREKYLEEYKKKINEKVSQIPDDIIQEPSLRVVGPAIEASKFFIEEDKLREMFATLIASSCDSRKSGYIHPSFIEIIKQMTPLEAKFLTSLMNNKTFPAVYLREIHKDRTITPYSNLLIDLKNDMQSFNQEEQLELTESIENIERFGLIKLNSEIIELNYNYNSFKSHWLYIKLSDRFNKDCEIEMKKYRIELTVFGKNFVKCCCSNE